MIAKQEHHKMLEKLEDNEAWSLGLSADWETRLAVDPRSTLATLRQLYGKTAARTPALEALYWRAVLGYAGSEQELAEAVLARLDRAVAEKGRLLDLEPQNRDLLLEHLRKHTERLFEGMDVNLEERQQAIAEPALLGEIALEEQGRRREAAAFYALSHDQISGQQPEMRFRRLLLCFLLCRSMVSPDEKREHEIQPFLALARRTVGAVDHTLRDENVPDNARQTLRFELHCWLGKRLTTLGDLEAAADAFENASLNAVSADDKIASTMRLAAALEGLGKIQEAYAEVLGVREELSTAKDPLLHQWWQLVYRDLKIRLGGNVNTPDPSIPDEGKFLQTQTAFDQVIRGEKSMDMTTVALEESLRYMLEDTPPSSAVGRHGILLQLAICLLAQGRFVDADVLLSEAAELEETFEDEKPKSQRQILLARRRAYTGDVAGAAKIFADLLPKTQEDPEDLPGFLGHYLEIFIELQDSPRVADLVDLLLVSLDRLLRRQPTAGARRYIRRLHQRPFETAVLALIQTAARAGVASDAGQRCLAKAWAVLDAARNLELHWQSQEPVDPGHSARLQQLEAAFHGQLRRHLSGDEDRQSWRKALDEVFEYEASICRDLKLPGFDRQQPPSDGVSIAFFEFADLLCERELLVLVCYQMTYYFRFGDNPGLQKRLTTWRDHCFAAASEESQIQRDVRKGQGRSVLGKAIAAKPPTIVDLIPGTLLHLTRRFFETDLEVFRLASAPEALEPVPWYVFPSGVIHSLPFEMLSEPGTRMEHFGNKRAVRLCLRSSPPASAVVRLDAGWLGVGGVPGLNGLPELKGALEEIGTIASWLQQRDFRRVQSLTGSAANSINLEARIVADPPAVLHLAMHGSKDEDYPDACALVLAPASGRPEGDLLPFRRIRQLPAAGVELVILSACSSLIGRSDHSAGMEGLAWAFLQAGAKQVIASRYPVDDVATLSFMRKLYERLLLLPPAQALGYTRDDCLRRGMSWLQVGAWSIWS